MPASNFVPLMPMIRPDSSTHSTVRFLQIRTLKTLTKSVSENSPGHYPRLIMWTSSQSVGVTGESLAHVTSRLHTLRAWTWLSQLSSIGQRPARPQPAVAYHRPHSGKEKQTRWRYLVLQTLWHLFLVRRIIVIWLKWKPLNFLIAALFSCVCSLIGSECLAWATLPATHITPKPGWGA